MRFNTGKPGYQNQGSLRHRFVLKSWASVFGIALLAMLAIPSCGCGRSDPTAMDSAKSSLARSEMVTGALPASMQIVDEQGQSVFENNTEAYDSIDENDFVAVMDEPQSTFSVDVDTASYANVRRMLNGGTLPPAGAVRIEELVNYFNYDYPEPDGEHPFSVAAQVGACPWKPENRLLRVGIQGESIDMADRRACNLVFLLDVSGSMMSDNKLPLVKSALSLLLRELNEDDRIAIVVYAGASGLVLDSTSAARADEIQAAIEELRAGGSTNGGQGIRLAYDTARENLIDGGVNRVILCTDGDFNVGTTNQSELVDLIEAEAKSDVFLTVLGFGSGNLKDSTMEKLADHGNGNYAYIDSMLEARKVLVEQVGGTLVTIAKDVKIQLDFNPRHVSAYRLLGYENRLLANQDFRDDSKDAGEIGAGHSVTAFYEIVPAGEGDRSNGRPSEFVKTTVDSDADSGTQLTVNLRYKHPSEDSSLEFQVRVPSDESEPKVRDADLDFRFASAVVGYGMLLRESNYSGSANWDWVVETASEAQGEDPNGLRAEFVQLAKVARRLSK